MRFIKDMVSGFANYDGSNLINGFDFRVAIVLVYTAVALSVVKYFGDPTAFVLYLNLEPNSFGAQFCHYFFNQHTGALHSMLFWIGSIIVFYLLIPMAIVRWGFKSPLSEFGLTFKGVAKTWPLYGLLVIFMLPLVFFASDSLAFQDRYPLFQPPKNQLFPQFLLWQMAYFLQFVAVEFFFRGFMVHGTKHRFGYYAVFVMVIPYCMVHFGKPFAETMAAIVAGVVLGMLSLKSRSVIPGIAVHYLVAITMDVMALWREGYF